MLVIANGAYGERMVTICEYLKIPHQVLRYADSEVPKAEDVLKVLSQNPKITHVGIIHSETTTGLLNPAGEIGKAIHGYNPNITYIVDAMSSFGAVHLDLYESHISYIISSSNKML